MNISVIRFSALGDLVTLEPMFRSIRHFYPNANIEFVTSALGKGLYGDTNYFDKYIVYKDIKSMIVELKDKKYDIVFNLHCNSLSHRIVYSIKKDKVVNSAANLLQKLLFVKVKVKPIEITLEKSGLQKDTILDYLEKKNNRFVKLPCDDTNKLIDTNKKIITISTGSSETWKSKQWGVNRYINLINMFDKDKFQICLIGTKLELDDEKKILESCENVISFVDKTNLTKLKQILNQTDVYVGNDSGPTHIAAAVQTPTVTIFGSTDIRHCVRFMPYLGEHVYLKPDDSISCHPCYKGICPTNHECMENILVESVYNEINKLF